MCFIILNNWYYDEPTDEHAAGNRRVVYTEDMIVTESAADCRHFNMTREQLIAEWVTCNWASPTDMPVGEYITGRPHREACGYCGDANDPNVICKTCFTNLS